MSPSARKVAKLGSILAGTLVLALSLRLVPAPTASHEPATNDSSERSATAPLLQEKIPAPSHRESPAAPSPARGGDPLHDLDVAAHPPSEYAARDERQHALFAAVSDALEGRDFERAKSLLNEHETSFPEDGWQDQHKGFELVLGCLEKKDLTSDAKRFLEEERISPLRRSVRRVCLEGREFHRKT